jgi:leader peptidase (prepilin peptidase)/N-methyltransferase
MPPLPFIVFVAVLGLMVGSFLNVCIHRLPRHDSLVWPASRCPTCLSRIKPYDNIPLVSYIALRGRCRSCGQPISLQYPVVEGVTALLFVGAILLFPPDLVVQRLVFACALLVLFFVDLEHYILPNVITLPGIAVGFLFSLFGPPGWVDSLIGLAAGGGVLWAIAFVYERIRREEGLGFGDVKMLAMIGAFLGWKLMVLTLVLSSFLGSLVGLLLIVLRKGDLKYALPYGTFLAAAALFSSVAGDRIVDWYASLY